MELDQFYTHPELARSYIKQLLLRWPGFHVLFVEPAAGSGAFMRPLLASKRNVRAMDLDPQAEHIEAVDFLQTDRVLSGDHQAIVVVGNPPFGKNACMAVKFFNHAANYADEIAFIVPRSFRKRSIQKRLNLNFHLAADEDVKPYAFVLNGRPHDVPCAWQIWTRQNKLRIVPTPPKVDHLIQYTKPKQASFAMRRVGFYAGKISTSNILALSATTHYFIKDVTQGVIDIMRHIDWQDLASQTAGVRSLAKSDIAFRLHEAYHA